jgi:hypothetical protein
MNFSEATGAPLILDTGRRKIAVPRFGLKDFSLWAGEIDAAKREEFAKNVEKASTDPKERFQFSIAYGVFPVDIEHCRTLVRTPAGVLRVVDTCLPRARVIERDGQRIDEPFPADEIAGFKEANEDQLESLAWALAGPRPQPKAGTNGSNGNGNGADPLPNGGRAASNAPPAIGDSTTQPSALPTATAP